MYKHIMVPLDGSELAECVLPHLSSIAKGCHVSKVTIVRVIEPVHRFDEWAPEVPDSAREKLIEQFKQEDLKDAKNYFDKVTKQLGAEGIKASAEVLFGRTEDELANYVIKKRVDLVIIASHGHSGPSRYAWGGVTSKVLRYANAPILMVRSPGCFTKYEKR